MLKVQFVQGAVCIENVIVQVNHSYCIESEKNIVVDIVTESVVSAATLRSAQPVSNRQVSKSNNIIKHVQTAAAAYIMTAIRAAKVQ